jgi:hypothetical protein
MQPMTNDATVAAAVARFEQARQDIEKEISLRPQFDTARNFFNDFNGKLDGLTKFLPSIREHLTPIMQSAVINVLVDQADRSVRAIKGWKNVSAVIKAMHDGWYDIDELRTKATIYGEQMGSADTPAQISTLASKMEANAGAITNVFTNRLGPSLNKVETSTWNGLGLPVPDGTAGPLDGVKFSITPIRQAISVFNKEVGDFPPTDKQRITLQSGPLSGESQFYPGLQDLTDQAADFLKGAGTGLALSQRGLQASMDRHMSLDEILAMMQSGVLRQDNFDSGPPGPGAEFLHQQFPGFFAAANNFLDQHPLDKLGEQFTGTVGELAQKAGPELMNIANKINPVTRKTG